MVDGQKGLGVTVGALCGADTGVGGAEAALLRALQNGDETAFEEVVARYTPAMLRVARSYRVGQAAAEDIVQEAWLRVLRALDRFEGRSSFRTWLFAILGNCARDRVAAEGRTVSVGTLDDEPAVSADRFFGDDHPRWAGMWTTLVDSWDAVPDAELLAGEARARFRQAIDELPDRYSIVFVLRDLEGWTSDEVCVLLDLTPANQRVLLHRARNRIRAALEAYVGEEAS